MDNLKIRVLKKNNDSEYLNYIDKSLRTSPIIPDSVDESHYIYNNYKLIGIILTVVCELEVFAFFIVKDKEFSKISNDFLHNYCTNNNIIQIKFNILNCKDLNYISINQDNIIINAHFRNYFKIDGNYYDIFEMRYLV